MERRRKGEDGRAATQQTRQNRSTLSSFHQRPSKVKIKAQRLDGSKFTTTLDGWPARIFQHEYDHLQGVLFVDRMAPDVRADRADARLRTLEARFREENPGVEF